MNGGKGIVLKIQSVHVYCQWASHLRFTSEEKTLNFKKLICTAISETAWITPTRHLHVGRLFSELRTLCAGASRLFFMYRGIGITIPAPVPSGGTISSVSPLVPSRGLCIHA
eukprot:17773-Rhodomonas_salina.1